MSITIKPHPDTKVISNIRATVVREFMYKVLRDQTEATLYGPNGELVDVLLCHYIRNGVS